MKKSPYFSVVVPTYNRPHDLRKSLASVLRQEFTGGLEVIVSDNCSTRETRTVIVRIRDPRIRYFRTHRHLPVQKNIAYAISKARGRYILLLGDDDILMSPSILSRVYSITKKREYGVIRLNYVSLSADKSSAFDFRASKNFSADADIPPHSDPSTIVRFILDMDASFMSGIICTNTIPVSDRRILSSELVSWFPILYRAIEHHGAYYFSPPSILASWSTWRPAKHQVHPLYSVQHGALSAEPYFEEVAKHLTQGEYGLFLKQQVFGIYVCMFPAAKYFTGNANLIQLAKRSVELVPALGRSMRFWLYLVFALIVPKAVWGWARDFLLHKRIRTMNIHTKDIRDALTYYRHI